jgi:hypothetical protein
MSWYFRKSDTIAIELSFLPKIVKYILHNMDVSYVGVALTVSRNRFVEAAARVAS